MATNAVPVSKSGIQKLIDFAKKWGVRIIIIGLIGLVVTMLIDSFGVGDFSYKKTVDLTFSDLKDSKLCGIKPGKRKYSFPREMRLEQEIRQGKRPIESHPNYHFIEDPKNGSVSRYNMADHIRLDGTIPGEILEVGATGCVIVTQLYPKDFKERAVIHGSTPSSPPASVALLVQFE